MSLILLIFPAPQRLLMTDRAVEELKKETQLNALIKNKRRQDFSLLYYSLWDDSCNKVLKLVDEWKQNKGGEILYLINSWDLPHAFTAFRVTKTPTLVKVIKGRVQVIDYYPGIYSYLKTCVETLPES